MSQRNLFWFRKHAFQKRKFKNGLGPRFEFETQSVSEHNKRLLPEDLGKGNRKFKNCSGTISEIGTYFEKSFENTIVEQISLKAFP